MSKVAPARNDDLNDEMTRLTDLARAKVNLSLRVLGRRPDGYHAMQSLVAFAGIGDAVVMDLTQPAGLQQTVLHKSGRFAAAIVGTDLVERAIERVLQRHPQARLGRVDIEKNLPVAAGLGGGSADAAAVLRLVQRANPTLMDTAGWIALAATLGADVPVCFLNVAAWLEQTGTTVTPIAAMFPLNAVLINTLEVVPTDKTRRVFAQLQAPPLSPSTAAPHAPPAFTDPASVIAFLQQSGNDLEAPARQIFPAVDAGLSALRTHSTCRHAMMSGGGPTCVGIFDSTSDSASAAASLATQNPGWWIVATTIS